MIPTMLVVGLVLGSVPPHWGHRWTAVTWLAGITSVGFGLLVGEPIGGTLVALANVAVGIACGVGIASLGRLLLGHGRSAPFAR